MKPLMIKCLVGAFAFGLFCTSTLADTIRNVTVPLLYPVQPDSLVNVPVSIDEAELLESFDLMFTYDTSRLELAGSGVAAGSLTSSNWGFMPNPLPGMLLVSGYSGIGPLPLGTGAGSIMDLTFHVLPGVSGEGFITLDAGAGLNEGQIPMIPHADGSVNVVPEPSTLLLAAGALVAMPVVWLRRRPRAI